MYIYGKNTIRELLRSGKHIEELYISIDFKDKEISHLIRKSGVSPITRDKNFIDNLVKCSSQGIVAFIPEFEYIELADAIEKMGKSEFKTFVILDQITDVHNLSSIIRTCECTGVDTIIIPKDRNAVINAATYKISSGAIFNMDICMVSNIGNAIRTLKDNGFWIVGSDLATDSSYVDIDYKMNVGLVIGSEGEGIRNSTRNLCDFLVKIPMVGKVNSLNASVATGVLLYQILNDRQG